MGELPLGLIERALAQDEVEQIIIIGKALDLSWETTKSVLMLKSGQDEAAKARLSGSFASFFRLKTKTARAAIQFYRLRQKADGAPAYKLFIGRYIVCCWGNADMPGDGKYFRCRW